MEFNSKNMSETGIVRDEHGKPCRSCMDFRSWMKMQKASTASQDNSPPKKENSESLGLEASGAFRKFNIPSADDYANGRRRTKGHSTATLDSTQNPKENDEDVTAFWGSAAKYGCPADSITLGKGSWRLLHTIAAHYPNKPTIPIQTDMKNFIQLFSKFYPCHPCAKDFREWIKENPPSVDSKVNLSQWFCVAHNEVNRKLEKSQFDCSLISQRWSEGWKDGSCD